MLKARGEWLAVYQCVANVQGFFLSAYIVYEVCQNIVYGP